MKYRQSQGVGVTSGVTLVKAFDSANSAGGLIIVALRWTPNTRSVSSVVDSRGNIYQAVSAKVSTTGVAIQLWYTMNVIAGANTVTATFDGELTVGAMAIVEYVNAALVAALDRQASTTGTGTSASSGNTPATQEGYELLFGLVGVASATSAPVAGAGWGLLIASPWIITMARFVNAAAAYAATASWTTSANWVCQIATFVARDPGLGLAGVG